MTHPPRLYAAIDIGSHSVKLTMAWLDPERGWHLADERVLVTGLGRDRQADEPLNGDARVRTLTALRTFAAAAREAGAEAIATVGTAVLREAPDAAAFVTAAHHEAGLDLEVISGQDEARLSYLGARLGQVKRAEGPILTVDIGGGSTEIAWGSTLVPDGVASLPLGSLSLTASFQLAQAVPATVVKEATDHALSVLHTLTNVPLCRRALMLGATPASLIAIIAHQPIADSQESHGLMVRRGAIDAWLDRVRRLDLAGRRAMPGLHPERAAVILGGLVLVHAVAKRWPKARMHVSAYDLRLGLLADRFGGAQAHD